MTSPRTVAETAIAGEVKPEAVAWAHEDLEKEFACYEQGLIFPADRTGDGFKFVPLYSASTVEALTAERDAAFAMSKCECGPDEACANLVQLRVERDALLSRVAKLEKALKPFADSAVIAIETNDGEWLIRIPDDQPQPTFAQFANARAALKETTDGK